MPILIPSCQMFHSLSCFLRLSPLYVFWTLFSLLKLNYLAYAAKKKEHCSKTQTECLTNMGNVRVISVKQAPEPCLTDAFTSRGSERPLFTQACARCECFLQMDNAHQIAVAETQQLRRTPAFFNKHPLYLGSVIYKPFYIMSAM